MKRETGFYPDSIYEAAPDPLLFDQAGRPVVFLQFPELNEENRVERVLAGFDALIDRREPFALVIALASHDHDDEPNEAERLSNIWLKNRKKDFGTYCMAIVYVTADPAVREMMEKRIVQFAKAIPIRELRVAGDRAEGERLAGRLLTDCS